MAAVGIPGHGIRSLAASGYSSDSDPLPVSLDSLDAIIVRTMPAGSLEQVIFRMNVLGELEARGILILNPPKAIEMAVDKYLTTAKLATQGFLTPRTLVCQSTDDAMHAFETLNGDVVLKPIFGGEGRGITRLSDEAIAFRTFKLLEHLGAVFYIQEFLQHEGFDLRVLVLGEKVFGMRRVNALDWRTNVSRGATGEPYSVPDNLARIAIEATQCVGATFAGVDLLPARDGKLYVLEVNAVPGWKAISKVLQVDIAREVIEWIERAKAITK